MTRHHVTAISHNKKTGPITVTRTEADTKNGTCPPSCPAHPFCYDKGGNSRIHRSKVDEGEYKTYDFDGFLEQIPNFTHIYRHTQGGDLWNGASKEHICERSLKKFVKVNMDYRRRPIIYTHKAAVGSRESEETRESNRRALKEAGADFAINVSVESLNDVDEAIDRGLDVVSVIPTGSGKVTRTPKGRKVVRCPEEYTDVQCVNSDKRKSCGAGNPLCLRKDRGYAIGFTPHGYGKKKANTLLKVIQEGV